MKKINPSFSQLAMGVALISAAHSSFAHTESAHRFEDGVPTHVIEVQASSREQRNVLANLGYALDDIRSDKVYVFASEKDLTRIREHGFNASAVPMKKEWLEFDNSPMPGAPKYHSFAESTAILQKLATDNPALVSMTTLGRSLENRDTPMIRISGKSLAEAEALKLPVIFYMGCHHAREHLSVEVPLLWAQYLVSEYSKNPDVKRLVDSREIYVSPVVNPDGHSYDYTNGIRGKMWRKNRRPNGDGTFGVDLNRNYGFGWGTGGSSTDTSSEVYMGTQPFSEPETQNIKAFINSQPRMTTLLTLHTFSELVLYPWGGSDKKIGEEQGNAADLPVFEKMAQTIASWNHYKAEQASALYVASGDTTDWAYGEHGIFAFTFELSPTSMWEGGFYPNPKVVEPTFQANLKPLMYLLEYADNPHRVLSETQRPSFNVTPAKTGVPMASFKDVQI